MAGAEVLCDYAAIPLVQLGVPAPHQIILRPPGQEGGGGGGKAARQARLAARLRAGLRRRGRKRARDGADISDQAALAAIRRLPDGMERWEMMGVRSEMYWLVQPREWLAQLGTALQNAAHRDYPTFTLGKPDLTVLQGGRRFHAVWALPHAVQGMGITVHAFHSIDGSSSFKIIGGGIRFACANGFVTGDYLQDAALRHLMHKNENTQDALNRLTACVDKVVHDTVDGLPRQLAAWDRVPIPSDSMDALPPMNVRVGAPHTFRELVAARLLELPRHAARRFLENADAHGPVPTKLEYWNAATHVATHALAHAPAARVQLTETIRRVFRQDGAFDALARHRRHWAGLLRALRARRRTDGHSQ